MFKHLVVSGLIIGLASSVQWACAQGPWVQGAPQGMAGPPLVSWDLRSVPSNGRDWVDPGRFGYQEFYTDRPALPADARGGMRSRAGEGAFNRFVEPSAPSDARPQGGFYQFGPQAGVKRSMFNATRPLGGVGTGGTLRSGWNATQGRAGGALRDLGNQRSELAPTRGLLSFAKVPARPIAAPMRRGPVVWQVASTTPRQIRGPNPSLEAFAVTARGPLPSEPPFKTRIAPPPGQGGGTNQAAGRSAQVRQLMEQQGVQPPADGSLDFLSPTAPARDRDRVSASQRVRPPDAFHSGATVSPGVVNDPRRLAHRDRFSMPLEGAPLRRPGEANLGTSGLENLDTSIVPQGRFGSGSGIAGPYRSTSPPTPNGFAPSTAMQQSTFSATLSGPIGGSFGAPPPMSTSIAPQLGSPSSFIGSGAFGASPGMGGMGIAPGGGIGGGAFGSGS
jgi:hypothetical protein